jgi:DNA mismatch repair protein MutS2
VDARHPLLGDKAVPLSLEMGQDFSVLVITGPNAGGKTVALKTIGLLSLMAQAGMPVPASEGSRLPVFDEVFVDIGDEQSIERTLSTFSWHMGNIIGIIGRSSSRSLVLLDELGVSTDPAQGSALARAVLLHFLSVGALTVATTHYSDLKAFAHATPGLRNASLDFDPLTLAPTYRLRVGVPGGSHTLATAARLGLPESILETARAMLARGSDELDGLLADLAAERGQIERLRDGLEQEQRRLKEREADLEARLQRLAAREQAAVQEVRDRLVREAAALQKDIRQAAAQLRRARSKEALEQGRQTLAAVRERLRGEEWQRQPDDQPEQAAPGESSIAPGDTVWLRDAGIPATVLSVSEKTGQVQAQAGSTMVSVGIDAVTKAGPAGKQSGQGPPVVTVPERRQQVPRELHLLGKRVEEAVHMLDSYLDAAALSGLAEVRIVHGSGTGALRTAVRELLGSHPLVRSFRPGERGEGGNGVTIVAL